MNVNDLKMGDKVIIMTKEEVIAVLDAVIAGINVVKDKFQNIPEENEPFFFIDRDGTICGNAYSDNFIDRAVEDSMSYHQNENG